MKIPFVGSSGTARSPTARNEKSLNVYVEVDKANQRAPMALYGTPGLTLLHTMGTGPHRGSIDQGDDSYFVSGNHIFRRDGAGVVVDCGAITTSIGRVGMASNGTEVIVVDGVKGWLVTGTLLSEIVDPDFPNGVTGAAAEDSYFIVFGDGSQHFYWSENPLSGVAWDGLDFASAESSPDDILGGVADHGQLWFIGSESGEVFDNTGNADQPFQRSGSTFLEYGTVSPWTVKSFDNSVVWLSRSKEGQGIFLRTQGGNPVRFSDHNLEAALATYSTLSDAYAFTFQMQGHSFYVVTFPTADKTWFFDAASTGWFEWGWRNPATNEDHRHRSASHVFVGGRHLVGDWQNGKVYSLDLDAYTDNGDPIRRLRRTQTVNDGRKRLHFANLILDMETGVGAVDTDPKVMLRYFDDDGRQPKGLRERGIGGPGEYGRIVRFPGALGATKPGKGRLWEVSLTDPVRFALFGADVEVKAGR